MKDKQEILAEIQEGLSAGILTENDLRSFMTVRDVQSIPAVAVQDNKSDKLSAVDIMFYTAGIVFFSTIMSIIVQSWDDGNAFVHILLSAGVGMILWTVVYYLLKSAVQTDVRKGLTNALLLTGSLLLVVGGYIITNELIGGYDEVNYIPMAITFVILGGVHLAFDRLVQKDLTLLMGVLLAVAAFPALLFGFLQNSDLPGDIWSLILVISFVLLAYATRIISKINPDRHVIRNSFDTLAAFLAMLTMYTANFGEYGVIWLGILIASVFGIFYLSIISQNKRLLGSASFFLILTVITISFKYFADFGTTVSLIVATVGLLGSAAIASNINKKYFKQPLTDLPEPRTANDQYPHI